MDRRDFFKRATLLAAGSALGGLLGCGRKADGQQSSQPPGAASSGSNAGQVAGRIGHNRFDPTVTGGVDVAVATNQSVEAMLAAVIGALGGLAAFVHKGDVVVIKPNLAWARGPAQAANTSPEVLAGVIKLCQQAGAGQVLVQDHTCANANATFDMSGAKAVCAQLGVPLVSLENVSMFRQVQLNGSGGPKSDQIGADILDCDALINVPICKRHSGSEVTLGMKNLMGTVWDRGRYHGQGSESSGGANLHRNIADLAANLRPTLNLLDATRALTTQGPQDGIVKELHTIVAAVDIVALDAYGTKLLGLEPSQVPHIRMAGEAGTGKADLAGIKVKTV